MVNMPPVNLLIGHPGRKNANADALSRAPLDVLSEYVCCCVCGLSNQRGLGLSYL